MIVALAASYAVGALATASIVMWTMRDPDTVAGQGIRALVKAYPHPAHLAIVFVAMTSVWPYMWYSAWRDRS